MIPLAAVVWIVLGSIVLGMLGMFMLMLVAAGRRLRRRGEVREVRPDTCTEAWLR